jgi:transcriptional regulator with XRE-family HTH domain
MNRIKALRKEIKITQTDLAARMNVLQSTVAMWESGTNMPRAEKLPLLAEIFGCTVDDLFDKTSNKNRRRKKPAS